MDMSLDYSPEDGDDPIVMKSDFIASIVKQQQVQDTVNSNPEICY